jgi:hypothetical protein
MVKLLALYVIAGLVAGAENNSSQLEDNNNIKAGAKIAENTNVADEIPGKKEPETATPLAPASSSSTLNDQPASSFNSENESRKINQNIGENLNEAESKNDQISNKNQKEEVANESSKKENLDGTQSDGQQNKTSSNATAALGAGSIVLIVAGSTTLLGAIIFAVYVAKFGLPCAKKTTNTTSTV